MATLWKSLTLVYRCDPRSFWLRVLCVVLQSLLPLANLFVLQLLVDHLADIQLTGRYVICFVVIFLAGRLVSTLDTVTGDVLSQHLLDHISDRIQRQSLRLDMGYYDRPEFHDTLHRAQQESSYRPLEVLSHFMSLFGALVTLVGVFVILGRLSPLIVAVMVVAVLPSFWVRLIKARRVYRFRRENTQTYRRTSYLSALLTQREFAKEVRQYGLGAYFRTQFVATRRRLVQRILHISRRLAAYDMVCAVVEAGALLLVLLLLLHRAYAGAITVGTFVMLFEAFRRGQSAMRNLVGGIAGLYDSRLFIGNLFEFLDLQPSIVNPEHPLAFPERVEKVEFRDVTFRYPGMERDVLSHFSLTAVRGTVCRIEGENGFGKSTLMKLLVRLYDPDGGSVRINDIDIRSFDVQQLRRHVGVLFQDFVRFYFSGAENIAFGRWPEDADASTVDSRRVDAAARQAAADTFLQALPHGYDNMLGRAFEGGEELSMGQWQRVALARLFYSEAPVLVFDEPTAWMDVPTRSRFYEALEQIHADRVVFLVQHAQ